MDNLTFGAAALTAQRRRLEDSVASILGSARDGALTNTHETQNIDFKEEAGRRNRGVLEPGRSQNQLAATKLADEVACLANTSGGGALIVGVEDKTGNILGTNLEVDWLRQRIHSAVDIAPDIQQHVAEGQRILVLYVSESPEPVADTGGRLRWRVGDSCAPIDRSEWWHHRQSALEVDKFALSSGLPATAVSPRAIQLASRWAQSQHEPSLSEETPAELLRRWGALRADNTLTEAASLLFCPHNRSYLELTIFDVPGGSILNRTEGDRTSSLLEQISDTERALELINTSTTVEGGLAHNTYRAVPQLALREAILNGVIHRDWNLSGPVEIRWTQSDCELTVRSPGGFVDGINEHNLISNRKPRYPALADLFRAIGLVDKQGIGIDRMYREMIAQGHRAPRITEVAGPAVECVLRGGKPVLPVLQLMSKIVPTIRQKDTRIALVLYTLFQSPFLREKQLQNVLQGPSTSTAEAESALEAAAQTTINGDPLITRYKDVWILGSSAATIVRPILRYHSTQADVLANSINTWLAEFPSITTGDLSTLCRISRGTAKKALEYWVEQGSLVQKGDGRSSRFELA